MEPFVTHAGRAVPLRRSNVDTDQIIPAEYLKQVSRTGFGKGLFAAWREDPSFVLNQPQYDGATILVAGKDFGTGSSREHAVWALTDYGFRAVIAPRFGDIFRGNSTKAGLLPVVLPEATVAALQDAVEAEPATEVVVDRTTTMSHRRGSARGRPVAGGARENGVAMSGVYARPIRASTRPDQSLGPPDHGLVTLLTSGVSVR